MENMINVIPLEKNYLTNSINLKLTQQSVVVFNEDLKC